MDNHVNFCQGIGIWVCDQVNRFGTFFTGMIQRCHYICSGTTAGNSHQCILFIDPVRYKVLCCIIRPVFSSFYGSSQSIISTGDETNEKIWRCGIGWWYLRCVQYTQPAAGACTDIEDPAPSSKRVYGKFDG